jgi:hypothetical protein
MCAWRTSTRCGTSRNTLATPHTSTARTKPKSASWASAWFAEVQFKQAPSRRTHENAVLKRLKFAAQSERLDSEQRSLLEDTLDADL